MNARAYTRRFRARRDQPVRGKTLMHIETYAGTPPPEAQNVDAGIEDANNHAAPLHEVMSMGCIAKDSPGVLGGAVGRRWGQTCELLQLWVDAPHRKQGAGAQLLLAFEALARDQGCTQIHLETFSFQAPEFYARHGYKVMYERRDFPHGIVKFHMRKML
jgi:GNAT superfamily N-acetyltransferase